MNRQNFWSIISTAKRRDLLNDDQQSAFNSICKRLSTESSAEIESFADQLAEALRDLDTSALFSHCADATPDSFLYARCFAIGMGEQFYQSVRTSPSKMPPATESFELLLYAPQQAWAISQGTDSDDWDYKSKIDFETGSNPNGWPQICNLRTITFRDSQALNKSLRELNSFASLALTADEVGAIYVQELDKLAFSTKQLRHLVLQLQVDNSDICIRAPKDDTEIYPVEIETNWYVSAAASDRKNFFVKSITDRLKHICLRDDLDVEKVNRVNAILS